MRRITLWLASTISALFLLFSYHTSTNAAATTSIVAPQTDAAAAAGTGTTSAGTTSGTASGTTTGGSSSSSGTSSSSGSSGSSNSATTPSTGSGSTASGAQTVDGSVVSTRYGNVQVQITVADGKVNAAKVLQVPWTDRKDQQINSRAVPILNSEAVAAQSADIDMVSGATYTSEAYAESLQAALDAAHI